MKILGYTILGVFTSAIYYGVIQWITHEIAHNKALNILKYTCILLATIDTLMLVKLIIEHNSMTSLTILSLAVILSIVGLLLVNRIKLNINNDEEDEEE